ncbi:MAG: hypothetical protein DWQ54_04970 [Microcystis flos-aquae TF09]|uniref:Uncharacterized protein n=1 Tax=Microcystis flos-aquae TF09 TaxID=2060473 RepID=A0A3E0LC09_9CHRO|nr:MAG: hypothetical protein DWQ54_04970 [Microcystis flos-aquae TF09]
MWQKVFRGGRVWGFTHFEGVNYLIFREKDLGFWLSQVWWVKCILRYIPPSEGVERTTKTQRTQRSII